MSATVIRERSVSIIETCPVVDWVPHRFVPDAELQEALKSCPGNRF